MMKRFLVLMLALMTITLLVTVAENFSPRAGRDVPLPWEVTIRSDGTADVLGVVLSETTLREAGERWGRQPRLALFAENDGRLTLEAYFGRMRTGVLEAHVIGIPAASAAQLRAMAARQVNTEPVPSGARKLELSSADGERALDLPLREINYVPVAAMDASFLRQRFGTPDERLPAGNEREYWVYPARGIVVLLDLRERRAELHFVAPAAFPPLYQRLEQSVHE